MRIHGSEEFLTVKEAASRTGKSVDTIRRRLRDNTFSRAIRDGNQPNDEWLIPTGDLQEAGFAMAVPTADDTTGDNNACGTHDRIINDLHQELAQMRGKNEALRSEVSWLRDVVAGQASASQELRRTA